MNSEIRLNLNIANKQRFPNENMEVEHLLDTTEKENLEEFLLDNVANKDGSPSIGKMLVKNYDFDASSNQGSFRLYFDIERRFCCSGVEACASDYLDFKINLQDGKYVAVASYFNWELDN